VRKKTDLYSSEFGDGRKRKRKKEPKIEQTTTHPRNQNVIMKASSEFRLFFIRLKTLKI